MRWALGSAVVVFGCNTDVYNQNGANSAISNPDPVGILAAGLVKDEDACTAEYSTSEFGPVNLSVPGNESAPSVAGIGGEKALLVWQSDDQVVGYDGEEPIYDEDYGIFARIVHNDGTSFTPSAGLDFWINGHAQSAGADMQERPDVSAFTDGNNSRVAITWKSTNEWGGSTGTDIVGSVWTWNNGTSSLTHNGTYNPTTTTSGDQLDPAVAHVWGGAKHVVVWVSGGDVYLSLCNNVGSCSPKEQKVNTTGFVGCQEPRVDGFREGEHEGYFVVVLSCIDSNPDPDTKKRIYYRRYDAQASALDNTLVLVNDGANHDDAVTPDVVCLAEDEFVVVYQYNFVVEESELPRIRRRHLTFAGSDVASDQYVSSTTAVSFWPRVTAYRVGTRYGVVWMHYPGYQDMDIVLRRYDQDTGSAIDSEAIYTGGTTTGIQGIPVADVMQCSGGWVMGWVSDHLAGTGSNEQSEIFGIFRND